MSKVDVIHGDCREAIKVLADSSIDACCTDPPYSLVSIQKRFGKPGQAPAQFGKDGLYQRASSGFMGQQWDTGETAHDPAFWAEVLRVLKPGAHLVAFGGTRTYHRLVCAIEDAGFEIRDCIFYCYGSGFPKSHNIGKKLDASQERCSCPKDLRDLRSNLDAADALSSCPESNVRRRVQETSPEPHDEREAVAGANSTKGDVRSVRPGILPFPGLAEEGETPDLLAAMQRHPAGERMGEARPQGATHQDTGVLRARGAEGAKEPGLEGRGDLSEASRQLRERSLRSMSAGIRVDGAEGRLRNGTSTGDGEADRQAAPSRRVRAPRGPSTAEQRPEQLEALAGQSQPQDGGAWPHCGRCGKPIIPDGLGTALKPALEPICLARKPLIGTVAANVQEFGTGALNIDGCRIETSDSLGGGAENPDTDAVYKVEGWDRPWMHDEKARAKHSARVRANVQKAETLGRWPANLCHDGSEEVIAAFPDGLTSGTGAVKRATGSGYQGNAYGKESRAPGMPNVEYGDTGSAARFFYAAKADADDRCDSKHPTVKPVSLMRWLARLVTPPGGLLLDPFAGSGTTGVACIREGFDCILIEREEKYVADIRRRLAKLQGLDTPLFKELRE